MLVLGISVAIGKEEEPFVIYTPDNETSRKHLAIGWKLVMDEDTKFRLAPYELVQKKGKAKSEKRFLSFYRRNSELQYSFRIME